MLDNLTELATQFRQMIESADRSKLTEDFERFPFRSGVDASILLAQYLIDLGYGIPNYVRGELYEPRLRWGHAWIELDGIILDITLDGLFSDQPPVIVTEDQYWHEMFRRLDEHPVSIHVFGKRNTAVLRSAYHEIIGLRVH
ncbi:MAG: hypothetical protein IIA07_11055 [Proteobacteria bacterium]|nr:hypothetical protein [Pseudomonadota bacterium]